MILKALRKHLKKLKDADVTSCEIFFNEDGTSTITLNMKQPIQPYTVFTPNNLNINGGVRDSGTKY